MHSPKIGHRAYYIKSGPHCDRIACERNGVHRIPSKRWRWSSPVCPDCGGNGYNAELRETRTVLSSVGVVYLIPCVRCEGQG